MKDRGASLNKFQFKSIQTIGVISMKKTLIILGLFIFSGLVFPQDYSIDHKQIKVTNTVKKYEVNIVYPVISNFGENKGINFESYYGFNSFVRKRMEAERDSFIVWMSDWEITEWNKNMSSEYEIFDSVYYAENDMISVLFSGYSYFAGAAHPNNWNFSINYDLDNNREIFLNDLLSPGWETKISEICIAEITKQKKENGIEPDEWVKDGAGPKEENFKVFNVKKDGLLITFPTYQVGSYAEGPSEVFISYTGITDIINKKGILGKFIK